MTLLGVGLVGATRRTIRFLPPLPMIHPEQRAVLNALGFGEETIQRNERAQKMLDWFGYSGDRASPIEEMLWSGFISLYLCFNSQHVRAWSRRHRVWLKPLALLLEANEDPFYRYTDRIGPTRLDLIARVLQNDLFDDTEKVLELVDESFYRTAVTTTT